MWTRQLTQNVSPCVLAGGCAASVSRHWRTQSPACPHALWLGTVAQGHIWLDSVGHSLALLVLPSQPRTDDLPGINQQADAELEAVAAPFTLLLQMRASSTLAWSAHSGLPPILTGCRGSTPWHLQKLPPQGLAAPTLSASRSCTLFLACQEYAVQVELCTRSCHWDASPGGSYFGHALFTSSVTLALLRFVLSYAASHVGC